MGVLLAIDQGTTGTTVSLVDAEMNVVATYTQEFQQHYPQPGWVEHRADQIWQSVLDATHGALRIAGLTGQDVVAIGITNQRETTLVWDRATQVPIHNAIVWQCRRTAPQCQKLRDNGYEHLVSQTTGLVVDAYFSGTKIAWLLDHVPGARSRAVNGELAFGTIDSYLVWRLTNGKVHVTDASNASRTMLMDIRTGQWSQQMADILEVPGALLPEIRGNAEIYGYTENIAGLPDGVPITGMAGDQQAALFGQTCFSSGESKLTLGTGAFLLVNTGPKLVMSRSGLLTTVAWRIGNATTYALEGSAFVAGAAVQWLRDGLGILQHSSDIEPLAQTVRDSEGVVFVPAFVGLGAPHWNQDARAAIFNLTRGTNRAHIARACLEGIALQNVDLLDAMANDIGEPVTIIKVDGGASRNNLLMQMHADFSGAVVVRPQTVETTSLGAALFAGLGVGLWKSLDQIRGIWKEDRRFNPQLDVHNVEQIRIRWGKAIRGISAR